MMNGEIIAGSILLVSYALIVSEKIHRTVAALIGAILMVILGNHTGFLDHEKFPTNMEFVAQAVDWNTIGLLMGMMIIVGVLKETGFFEFIAIKTAKVARGNPWRIMLTFSVVTALLSAFLDNVTTVLLITPVTISITGTLGLNPIPYLMAEVLASNIGGAATLIGDPPNIMIGSGAGLSFNDFIMNLGPIIIIVLIASIVAFKIVFRRDIRQPVSNIQEVMAMDEWEQIKDMTILKKSLGVMGFTIVMFFMHHSLHIEPSIVAIMGATLLLLVTSHHPDRALHEVEWTVLLFFVGLFVIVKGVEEVGIIEKAAQLAVDLTQGDLSVALMVIMWVSAIASAIVDNIPFTATMIPLIHNMSADPSMASQLTAHTINPLWWSLALGACLGGNGSLIGASANVVVAGISERMGYPITFMDFLKVGAPIMFLTVAISSVLLYIWTFVLNMS